MTITRTYLSIPVLIGIFIAVSASAQSITERAERGEVTHMARENPAMQRAFQKARASLDEYFKIAANPPADASMFAVKVALSDGKNTEYFWVNRVVATSSGYTGHLGNEPRLVKKYRFDEKLAFDRIQIVDWTYHDQDGRRMRGNFTACALLTNEPKEQAQAFMRKYGLECE